MRSAASALARSNAPPSVLAVRRLPRPAKVPSRHLLTASCRQIASLQAAKAAHRELLARALDHWRALDVERYSHELFLDRVWQLRDHVSAYDAVYVALAEALPALLVTGDGRLLRAPGLRARIELA